MRVRSGGKKFVRSIIVSLTIPPGLLEQIDELAGREHATRSWIMRRAMRKYVEESGIRKPVMVHAADNSSQRDLTGVAKKYPRVDPLDTELLEFLDDLENDRL
jgi:ribbon-helix-helix CopG family protein